MVLAIGSHTAIDNPEEARHDHHPPHRHRASCWRSRWRSQARRQLRARLVDVDANGSEVPAGAAGMQTTAKDTTIAASPSSRPQVAGSHTNSPPGTPYVTPQA